MQAREDEKTNLGGLAGVCVLARTSLALPCPSWEITNLILSKYGAI
jgi:hypothetical protein